jgi:hypothetical protein
MSIELLADKTWRMNNLYRIVDRDGNSIPFRLNKVQAKVLSGFHNRNIILKARQLGMCLDPNTKILKSDFTWVRIGDMKAGDEIIGVDETPRCQGSARKLRKGTVEGVFRRLEKAYRITFENGKTLICTGQHRWLARNTMTDYHWRSIEGLGKKELKLGNRIRRITADTWEKGSFEDGWMGGMLDGEGSLAKKSRLGGSINVSQIQGAVFDRLEAYFGSRGYNYRIEVDKADRPSKFGKKPVNKIVVAHVSEVMKLIGITRPSRFLDRDWWEGKKVPLVVEGNYSTIIKIESIGEREVVDLQTSIKTYIADGYVSHNSTFAVLYILDEAIFNNNLTAGIVSYSRDHAEHIFKKIIGHAVDELRPMARELAGVVQRSTKEITFKNGSTLRVDTTLRGGAYQLVLVSEFGKTCARNPLKAQEVVTGTLNAISKDSTCIIESTGEGNEGYYTDMVNIASQHENKDLSPLQYKLFFFNWLEEDSYVSNKKIEYEVALTDYFDDLEKKLNTKITQQQRNWYAEKRLDQGDKMRQEFPSTVSEAFLSSSDAYYFQQCIELAYQEKRCVYNSLYDAIEQVYIAMDIGVNDLTVITFFQIVHGEIRIIDYYEDNNKGVDFYSNFLLQDKPYIYNTVFLPHDAAHRDGIVVENTYERDFRRYFQHTETKFIVLPRTDKNLNISNAKIKFSRCVFNVKKVKPFIDVINKYRKKWSEQYGKYLDEPCKNDATHHADSFIYAMQAVTHIEAVGGNRAALQKHKKAVQRRNRLF